MRTMGIFGGNHHDFQTVNIVELQRLRFGGTGHAGKLFIHAEIILKGDGGKRLVFIRHLYAFLCLEGLMETFGIAPARHEPAGELVHDNDFSILDHIVDIAIEQRVRLEGLVEVMNGFEFRGVVEVVLSERSSAEFDAFFGEDHGVGLLVLGVEILLHPSA